MLALGYPVVLRFGSVSVPAHLVLELLAYAAAARVFLALRRRVGDPLASSTRWGLVAAAAVGAALGSRLLSWLVDPAELRAHALDAVWLVQQKTIVGAILGGWLAVEWLKRRSGLHARTGDLYAVPLCVGIALGRLGCHLSGLADRTFGTASGLPWALDLGDGVPRHPVALYESAFALALGAWLLRRLRRPHREGEVFRLFLAGYFAFRLAVDALKPAPTFLGLGTLQWASLAALLAVVLAERPSPAARLARTSP